MVNGPKFIQRVNGKVAPDMPYILNLEPDIQYRLMRNCLIKDELYYY
jgi:hypothetical protein